MKKYDIFISYRREGGADAAKHLRDVLSQKGYRVFFDTDSLRSGDFNRELLRVIGECSDFILILTPGALDRCVSENDWVRQELRSALENGKNVIPVLSSGFSFPDELPADIDAVRYKNGVPANRDYFDAVVDKLCSFLSVPPKKMLLRRRVLPVLIGVLVGVLALAGLWSTVLSPLLHHDFPHTKKEKQAVTLTADYVYEISALLDQAYGDYRTALKDAADCLDGKASAPTREQAVQEADFYLDKLYELLGRIPHENQAVLGSLTGIGQISTDDVFACPSLAVSLISTAREQLQFVREMLRDDGYQPRDVAKYIEMLQTTAYDECDYWLTATNQLFCAVDRSTVNALLLETRLPGLTNLWHADYRWTDDETALSASETNCAGRIEEAYLRLRQYYDSIAPLPADAPEESPVEDPDTFTDAWIALRQALYDGDAGAAETAVSRLEAAASNEAERMLSAAAGMWTAQGTPYSGTGCVIVLVYGDAAQETPSLLPYDFILSVDGTPVNIADDLKSLVSDGLPHVLHLLRQDEQGVLRETDVTAAVDPDLLAAFGLAYD